MTGPEVNSQTLWAVLVVSALVILTAWGNAYAMLALALVGIFCAMVYNGFKIRNLVAVAAGCIFAVFIAYILATIQGIQ